MKEDQKPIILPTLTLRNLYHDGRCACVLVDVDGGWKVEIFGSVAHAQAYADKEGYEFLDPRGYL